MKQITGDDIIYAIDAVTWYNGLDEIIREWKMPGYFDDIRGKLAWNWKRFHKYDQETQHQLEVIWIICVCLFGEYGTSPRSGWIEDKEGFYAFLDQITTKGAQAAEIARQEETGHGK